MEKPRNVRKFLFTLILIILVIYIIFVLRNLIILGNLSNKVKQFSDSQNYFAKVIQSHGDSVTLTRSYNKDSKYLTSLNMISLENGESFKLNIYKDETEKIGTVQNKEGSFTLNEGIPEGKVAVNSINNYSYDFWSNLGLTMTTIIKSDKCNNEDCYMMYLGNGLKIWVSKDTGLIVRKLEGSFITEFSFEFNNVTDNDLIKPTIENN